MDFVSFIFIILLNELIQIINNEANQFKNILDISYNNKYRMRRSEVIPRGRRSFKYGEEPRGGTPNKYDERNYPTGRPVNLRPLVRI